MLDQGSPLPGIILEHRKINKIASAFLEPLVDLANKQPEGKQAWLVCCHTCVFAGLVLVKQKR